MTYFNYHACAKKLIKEGKLIDYYFTEKHGQIKPALVLIFNNFAHPIMPIREDKFDEYLVLITQYKRD